MSSQTILHRSGARVITKSMHCNSRHGFRLLLLTAVIALAGCQTIEGFGKDVSYASRKTGEALSSSDDQPRTISQN